MALAMLGVMTSQFLVVTRVLEPDQLLQVDALAPLLRLAALSTPLLLIPGARPSPRFLGVYCWGWVGVVAAYGLGRMCVVVAS